MKIIIKEPVIDTDKYETVAEMNIDEVNLNYSINEILNKFNYSYRNFILLAENDKMIPWLDYYYNSDGILEFYKNALDVPISKFSEYGIDINETINLTNVHEIGAPSGFDELFLFFYNHLVLFASTHPILFSLTMDISISQFKIIAKKIVEYVESKCTFNTFKRALYHKKKMTEKDVYNAFDLKEVDANRKETEAIIAIILEYFGYEYNEEQKQWVLDEKNKI